MLSLTPTQEAARTATAKQLEWLFDITPVGQPTLHWSIETTVVGATAYLYAVIPDTFAGVRCPRARTEAGMIPMSSCGFSVSNAGAVPYDATSFKDAALIVRMRINGTECRTWRMVVTSCVPGHLTLVFEAKGFLSGYLKGDLPNGPTVKSLDPTYQFNDSDCVPIAYGPAYLPLPCILDANYRHYLLGVHDPAAGYTVTACASGAEWQSKSTWLAAEGFVFEQAELASGGYQLLRPLVYNLTGDSSDPEYVTGLSPDGQFRPICAQFTFSRTASMTNPGHVIADVLQQMGLDATEMNGGSSVVTYDTWGLSWSGGWTRRQGAEPFLASLLAECHSEIDCRDKVYYRPISAEAVFTLADVLDDGDGSSWGYTPQIPAEYNSGHFTYSAAGTPDDRRISAIAAADSSAGNPGFDQFHFHLVHHSIAAQTLACLRYQRRLLVIGRPTWLGPLSHLALQPGDVILVDNDDYGAAGGSYRVVIDEMFFERQGTIRFQGIRLARIDDYATLAASFGELVIPEDGSEPTILPPYIDDLHNPDVMTRTEIAAIRKEWNGFVAEHPGLAARASSLGITTELITYLSAYAALSNIVTPLMAVRGLKTSVSGDDYHTAWSDYIAAKAVLISTMDARTTGSNQVGLGNFAFGSGGWDSGEVVAVTGQTFAYALRINARDVIEDVPHWCSPLDWLYVAVWLRTVDSPYNCLAGCCFYDINGDPIQWGTACGLPSGEEWTYCTGIIQVPEGAVYWQSWVLMDAASPGPGEVAEFGQLYISSHEQAATHGAIWPTNIQNIPANLATLTGTEEINNTLITITSLGGETPAGAQAKATAAENAARNYADTYFVLATDHTTAIATLQGQIDGNITSWFYAGVPTLANAPALEWDTIALRNMHLGDLYYDTTPGHAYRFALVDTVYQWQLLSDSDVTLALNNAQAAQDTADGKRRVFVVQPSGPYDIGDLWDTGSKVMRANADRTSGYLASEWVEIANYIPTGTAVNQVGSDGKVVEISADIVKSGILKSANYEAGVSGLAFDLTNAVLDISGAAGLVVKAAGGITVTNGGGITVTDGGGIVINDGGDLFLLGDDSSPGKITFAGTTNSSAMATDLSGDFLCIYPNTENMAGISIGALVGGGRQAFKTVKTYSYEDTTITAGMAANGANLVLGGYGTANESTASLTVHYGMADNRLLLEYDRLTTDGMISIKEVMYPSGVTGYGTIYTKNDNKIYFIDGDGTTHEVAFV